jgi:hypothetical protein
MLSQLNGSELLQPQVGEASSFIPFSSDSGCSSDFKKWLKSNKIKFKESSIGDSNVFQIKIEDLETVKVWFIDNGVRIN